MADKKQPQIEYEGREELDAQLNAAIGEILSAEQEAARIVEQAEASVKAIQLDGATRERELRDMSAKKIAANHERMLLDAAKRAEAESEKKLAEANAAASAMVKTNAKKISAVADELFKTLAGDK